MVEEQWNVFPSVSNASCPLESTRDCTMVFHFPFVSHLKWVFLLNKWNQLENPNHPLLKIFILSPWQWKGWNCLCTPNVIFANSFVSFRLCRQSNCFLLRQKIPSEFILCLRSECRDFLRTRKEKYVLFRSGDFWKDGCSSRNLEAVYFASSSIPTYGNQNHIHL